MEGTPKLAPGMQIGDYLLKELISEGAATRTWYAEQISVRREVIVDSLRSAILQNDTVREAFLEDVRAKARVDHPLIGSVFEAVRFDDVCFYARERLAGETLERYVERGEKMAPGDVVHILKQVAEANLYLERNNIGSIPIGPHQIYIGDKYLTRLVNMGIGEQRDHNVSSEDKVMLGSLFREILNRDMPGATRVNSLCDFMVDRQREIPITWEQIRDLSEQVQKQLREVVPTVVAGQEAQTMSLKDKDVMRNMAIAIGVVILLLGIIGAVTWFIFAPKPTHARDLDEMVAFDGGVVDIKGKTFRVGKFEMDAHEVTIEEYKVFLDAVEANGYKSYASRRQPAEITNYYPNQSKSDWDKMYSAAINGRIWNSRTLGLNQAMTGISWWAAAAYANWKSTLTTLEGQRKYSLPGEEHWKIVLQGEDPKKLQAGAWMAVDKNPNDITKKGIHGLAGCVSEWSSSIEEGLDGRTKAPVVLGASFSKKEKGVAARTVEKSRNTGRADLGFRLIRKN